MQQKILLIVCAITTFVLVTINLNAQGSVITIDANTTYQTMTGWEATDFNGNTDLPEFGIYGFNPPVMTKYKDILADLAVNDLGLNRVRLEVMSGAENPIPYYTQYINNQITRDTWKQHRQEIINDNNDPNNLDITKFNFDFLDHKVDTVVIPMKQALEANGEKLYINLNYVNFDGADHLHKTNPEEYAEFIVAVFDHLQTKYGWVPDGLEVILEPDNGKNNGKWSGKQVGDALVAAAIRLQANGYTPDFIAPSNAFLGLGMFDEMVQSVPQVLNYLTEFSYHCYSNCNTTNLQGVGARRLQHNVNTSHLEHIGHKYPDLHRDLTLANVSAWAQYTLAGPYPGDGGGDYFFVDISDQNNPTVSIQRRAKFLRQYIKFIKPGAIRIGATSNSGTFDPVAFINPDGNYVVVVKSSGSGGNFSIQNLPAGTYGIKYTIDDDTCDGIDVAAYDVDLTDTTITTGQALTTNIPHCGVITIYGKNLTTAPAPSNVTIDGPGSGFAQVAYSFTAEISPTTVNQPITYTWKATGQEDISHVTGISDTVSFTWNTPGAKTITVTAQNSDAIVSDIGSFDVTIASNSVYLPTILKK